MEVMARWTRSRHDDMVGTVVDVLSQEDWQVEREPVVGSVRPDIVALSPSGARYVFEVKQSELDTNLGAVAQVETFRNAVDVQEGGSTTGVLLVAGTVPSDLYGIAGIEVVSTGSVDIVGVRESLAKSGLLGDGPAQPSERTAGPRFTGGAGPNVA
jgi:hypothetical protein